MPSVLHFLEISTAFYWVMTAKLCGKVIEFLTELKPDAKMVHI